MNAVNSTPTSMGLLQRVKAKEPDAWKRLAALYSPLIYQWCRRSGLSPHDSADVMQDVFVTVLKAIGGFRTEESGHRFRGWLQTITHSRIVDHHRRHGRQVGPRQSSTRVSFEPACDEPSHAAEEPANHTETQLLFRRAVELMETEFETRTWQAFWRFAIEGEDSDQIGRDLGISPNTVRKYKSRVLRRMREEFSDLIL